MNNDDKNRFDFFSSRLTFIEVTSDQLINIDFLHYLSAFENHVYGVFMQYNRIKEDLKYTDPENLRRVPGPQASLDIYYYILTWDKLRKILEKINNLVNRLSSSPVTIPKSFKSEYRNWRRRIEHLFSEFDTGIRNEYEHPSMEPYRVGNIQMWGNIIIDRSGNFKAHAGKDYFFIIKKGHVEKIKALRTDLFDLFIKHFSEKPLTEELIKLKNYIEQNIDSLIKELADSAEQKKWEDFNNLFYQLTMCDLNLSKEGIQLSQDVKTKIFSVFQSSG